MFPAFEPFFRVLRAFSRPARWLLGFCVLIPGLALGRPDAWPAPATRAMAAGYDPLVIPAGFRPLFLDLSVADAARQREIPLRVYLPAARPAPVVLFSHGLGGSREGSAYLGQHWAARGYVAVFVQHPGSDASVWQNLPATERKRALQQAASLQNYRLRVQDIPAVLNQLSLWQTQPGHALQGRLNLARIGMSGHSFGALTTQAVSGQAGPGGRAWFRDARIVAALMMSPSAPRQGSPAQAFGQVAMPWMLMTGTADRSPIGNTDVASRLAVFPALPPGGKYELVLDGAEHSAFSDRPLPGDALPRNPNHHRVILALSTAFWDAWLRQDAAARRWLAGDGPRRLLEPRDRWQTK